MQIKRSNYQRAQATSEPVREKLAQSYHEIGIAAVAAALALYENPKAEVTTGRDSTQKRPAGELAA